MKKNKRPQAPKTRSILTKTMIVEGRGGIHAAKNTYKRKPKHVNRGWDN
jgi:hypothetical protein